MDNKSVLAMYDIRGIQNYIFRTNDIKEIIGASIIVESIIVDGLNEIITQNGWDKSLYITDWANDEISFLENESIKMQVLFIGGGNAYVLYRDQELCSLVNRALAEFVLTKTYSLQLAVAVVEKSEDYTEDYRKINEEMRKVKSQMPSGRPTGAFPFMKVDPMTGFPIIDKKVDDEYLSTESYLKREMFRLKKKEGDEKIHDNLIKEKGDNSTIALVHIDGNNMGRRLMEIMSGKTDYRDAALTMRKISRNIDGCFKSAFEKMKDSIEGMENAPNRLVREIILAGDDITFICNAFVAIKAVEVFLKYVSSQKMYGDTDSPEVMKKYAFSSCAGIAFFNSHFPFSDAYQVAEACCSSAKKRAKDTNNRSSDNMIGSFLDYQICTNIMASNLDSYREKHYQTDDRYVIMRPYYVGSDSVKSYSDLNEKNEKFDLFNLKNCLSVFNGKDFPRSQAKTLRDYCIQEKNELEQYKSFLKSRGRVLPEGEEYWYDALEIIDISLTEE